MILFVNPQKLIQGAIPFMMSGQSANDLTWKKSIMENWIQISVVTKKFEPQKTIAIL